MLKRIFIRPNACISPAISSMPTTGIKPVVTVPFVCNLDTIISASSIYTQRIEFRGYSVQTLPLSFIVLVDFVDFEGLKTPSRKYKKKAVLV